jgi:hypothetical protein
MPGFGDHPPAFAPPQGEIAPRLPAARYPAALKYRRRLFSRKLPPRSADYIELTSAREFVSRIRGTT